MDMDIGIDIHPRYPYWIFFLSSDFYLLACLLACSLIYLLTFGILQKRNAVLDRIAKHLVKSQKKAGQVHYQWPQGSSGGAPRLRLVPPSKKKSPKYQVYLHVGMETIEWIPSLRLVPNRVNNTKTTHIEHHHHAQFYNHTLLHDARHLFEDPHLAELQEHPNVQATMVLVQVWALQRGLWRNHDGWSPESVGMFLLYLLRTNKMNPRMTPVQLFTVVLQTWATTNWLGDLSDTTTTASTTNKEEESTVRAAHTQASTWSSTSAATNARRTVLVLPLEDATEKETMQASELARSYQQQTKESPLTENDPPTLVEAYASTQSYTLGPVFLDPTMTYNYLGGVSNNYMKLMQAKAAKSLERLQSRNAFGHLFMKPARFWSQWDLYVQIPALQKGDWEDSTRKLVATLEQALGNRMHGMRVLSTGNGEIEDDADEIPTRAVVDVNAKGKTTVSKRSQSPVGTNMIVLGIAINPETSQRAVDRGPPSDHSQEVKDFVKLWGAKAQLRRFKDGAIVQAVVWNDTPGQFQNEDRLNGGIVERVVRHIVQVHHTKDDIKFSLPNLVSTIDGVVTQDKSAAVFTDPLAAQRNIMKVFDSLSTFLRNNSQPPHPGSKETSKLGLPLTIDGVEPLSPSLRYSELFPPVPHPFLGGASTSEKKVAGVLVSNPILIQIRFGSSSKWPTDLKAMGAAKAAMLIQLANGIEDMGEDGFEGPITVTPSYAELGYKGYCFRILVRADPEIKMLQGLQNPSQEAAALLKDLTQKHLVASRHHATIHGVHTLHPSAGAVVRMAKRWVSSHLLSGLISVEAIELMVASVYTDVDSPVTAPSTVATGFLRFLRLLATHDWARYVLKLVYVLPTYIARYTH
jgi:U3 small nucleolar RNA-associated protein 22